MSKVLSADDELGAQDQVIDNSDKVKNLPQSLPVSFRALAMASTLGTNTLDDRNNDVSANIEHRKKFGNWKEGILTPLAHFFDGNETEETQLNHPH